jgi:hypothetical protein
MNMRGLSVREIAERIRRPHEELGTVVDRIRGWSDVGLIDVLGSKFPGTGQRRRYGPEAIIDALILTALTDAGLAAVRVGHFQGIDGQTVRHLGRLGAAAVFDPAHISEKVYLVIAGSPVASIHTTYVAYAGPATEHVMLPPDATWSIVLHLNEIFRVLKGFVVAKLNKERGFVEVEFTDKNGSK